MKRFIARPSNSTHGDMRPTLVLIWYSHIQSNTVSTPFRLCRHRTQCPLRLPLHTRVNMPDRVQRLQFRIHSV